MHQHHRYLDHPYSGFQYTWTNNGQGSNKKSFKIDRVMVNNAWFRHFSVTSVCFTDPLVSDHFPSVLTWHNVVSKPKPFRFCNAWRLHPNFERILLESWRERVVGSPTYILSQKLRNLKKKLKRWSRENFSGLHDRSSKTRKRLKEVQI